MALGSIKIFLIDSLGMRDSIIDVRSVCGRFSSIASTTSSFHWSPWACLTVWIVLYSMDPNDVRVYDFPFFLIIVAFFNLDKRL